MQILVLLLKSEKNFFENCRNPRNNLRYFAEIREKIIEMNISADWWIFCPTDCTDYTDGGPQADEADEQGLINDGRLFTHYKFSAVFIKLRRFLIADYWLLITDDWWLLMIDYSHIIYFQQCSSSYASFWLVMTDEQWAGIRERIRLEAYTFSNRGEMRQHLPTGYDIYLSSPGWKPVPLILWYLVLASSQQSYATISVPRTTSTVTQSIGFQPMQWWWVDCAICVPRTASPVTQGIGFQPS